MCWHPTHPFAQGMFPTLNAHAFHAASRRSRYRCRCNVQSAFALWQSRWVSAQALKYEVSAQKRECMFSASGGNVPQEHFEFSVATVRSPAWAPMGVFLNAGVLDVEEEPGREDICQQAVFTMYLLATTSSRTYVNLSRSLFCH